MNIKSSQYIKLSMTGLMLTKNMFNMKKFT